MSESDGIEMIRVIGGVKVEWIAVENAVEVLRIVEIEWFYASCRAGIRLG